MPGRVFITVAEVSGDQHASHLVRSLRELDPTLAIEGHGGPDMLDAGATIHHETTTRAVMGHRAAARAGEMWRLFRWTREYFDRERPDLQICVDSPSMNFHFAKIAHERGIPVLYYIAPQLWAWREGRMKKLRKWVDHVACILPFEENYFRSHGVTATFVGHPLFDDLPAQRGPAPGPRFPDRTPVIGLLAGSRRSEAVANFPHLLDVAHQVRAEFPGTRYLVPTTPATHPIVHELAGNIEWITSAQAKFDEMVPNCDLCLTVSGTATLHVAGYGIPMIIVYRGSPVLWQILGRWIVKTRTFGLVNLLADQREHNLLADQREHIVPEYIPWHGSNRTVARHAISFLTNPQLMRDQQKRLADMVQKLDRPGASMNVARIAIDLLKKKKATDTESVAANLEAPQVVNS
jgi:lipid-A-disaccharide synthase